MSRKSRSLLLGLVIVVPACFGVSTSAMRVPRMEMFRGLRAAGTDMLLSNPLPPHARVSFRPQSAEISRGPAPQPAITRAPERNAVMLNISSSLEVAEGVTVPERIPASREARPVTIQEVFTAIRSVLDRNGFSGTENFRPQDILLQTQILVAPGDAGLEVIRSDFDPELKRGRFLLWASHSPKVLPFYVTVRWDAEMPPMGLHSIPRTSGLAHSVAQEKSQEIPLKAEALVTPGQQATLLLHSRTFRMIADVVSLERGTMGQRIHVRVIDTGKVFSAQVDGRAHLETTF